MLDPGRILLSQNLLLSSRCFHLLPEPWQLSWCTFLILRIVGNYQLPLDPSLLAEIIEIHLQTNQARNAHPRPQYQLLMHVAFLSLHEFYELGFLHP